VQPPSNDFLAELFFDCLKEPEALDSASAELIASIQRLRASLSAETKMQYRTAEWGVTSELGHGDSSVVRLVCEPEGTLSAVKFPETLRDVQLIQREAAIHKELKHPLILEFRGNHPGLFGVTTTIVTEFAENGSLASYLPSAGNGETCRLPGETRIARIIVGIVLAMRYIHSKGVIHCDLNPDNILLDCDWNVRIADFGLSISPDEPTVPNPDNPYQDTQWSSADSHYLAPECYDGQYGWESNVFSFGLILYELVAREPAFPKHLNRLTIAKLLIIDDKRPTIPAFVLPDVKKLICECWKCNPSHRPTFNQILNQLEEMKFKLTANVNSSKLSEFVKKVKDWEKTNDVPTALPH
jgi:serine/threonine protein kinase